MIDPKRIRENYSEVETGLNNRRFPLDDLLQWKTIDQDWRKQSIELENLQAQRNQLLPKGKPEPEVMVKLKALSDAIQAQQGVVQTLENELKKLALQLPNIPVADVPVGASEADNVELRKVGSPPSFAFTPKTHDELGESLNILDFTRAAVMSGARFALYKGLGAKLERALIQFMLDTHTELHGYTELMPPVLVNSQSLVGTGQLPKFAEDSFKIDDTDLWLSPTAEVQLTNFYRDSIIDEKQLPVKLTAHTACFRKEAGSYGKDMNGLIRLHQFNKVELVQIVQPEQSEAALQALLGHAETILRQLELPYRVLGLCTGDMGFSSAKTYDIEVWIPSQNTYREISSCSTFTDFQSRRAMIRYRNTEGKVQYAHTINGSGLAVGRTFAAILENYQQADGSIKVPKVLRKYLGVETI